MTAPPTTSRPVAPSIWVRLSSWLMLFTLIAGAAWFVVQRVERGRATPQCAALDAALAILKPELRVDDAMAFLPTWSANQRWRFEALWRSRNQDFIAAWMPGSPIDPWDAADFKRLWVLTSHNAHTQLKREKIGQLLREEQVGVGMKLLLFRLRPSRVVYDFRTHIGAADMRRIGPKPGVEERCRAVGDEQRCRGDWWTNVSSALHEVGNTRRRCLFVQPHPAGATLRLRWDAVPEGDEVAGRVGNQLWAVRYDEGSAVRFTVRIDGKIRYTLMIERGDFSWHEWRVRLRPEERGKAVSLEFAAADPTWRQLCVDARVLSAAR